MTATPESPSGLHAGPDVDFKASRRVRWLAAWAGAFFAAAVPAVLMGAPMGGGVGFPLAFSFWLIALIPSAWAAIIVFRRWDRLSEGVRWLGVAPALAVSAMLTLAVLAPLFAGR